MIRAASPRCLASAGLTVALVAMGALPPLGPAPATAQNTADALAGACVTAGGLPEACGLAGAIALATQGQLSLLGGLGSEVPGTATTLGTRVPGGPRLSFAVRAAAADGSLPFPGSGAGSVSGPFTALHVDATLGLFDGLRLMPTVGGFLSLDAFGRGAFVFLPEAEGYPDATVYTVGVRVGVVREGFTIPGVSASFSRRFSTAVDVGQVGAPVGVRVDPGITSIRATVGKDLWAVEWLAGFGWDDFGSDVVASASDGGGGSVDLAGRVGGSRRLWFVGASTTLSIVLNLAVEAGWAEGFDPMAAYAGGWDPTAGVPFGSLSARLIL